MNDEQKQAIAVLSAAFMVATECGALDELLNLCKSPDSINDVCDACDCALNNDGIAK